MLANIDLLCLRCLLCMCVAYFKALFDILKRMNGVWSVQWLIRFTRSWISGKPIEGNDVMCSKLIFAYHFELFYNYNEGNLLNTLPNNFDSNFHAYFKSEYYLEYMCNKFCHNFHEHIFWKYLNYYTSIRLRWNPVLKKFFWYASQSLSRNDKQ